MTNAVPVRTGVSPVLRKLAAQRTRHALTALPLQHHFTVRWALHRVQRRAEGGGGWRLFWCDNFDVLRTIFYLSVVLSESFVKQVSLHHTNRATVITVTKAPFWHFKIWYVFLEFDMGVHFKIMCLSWGWCFIIDQRMLIIVTAHPTLINTVTCSYNYIHLIKNTRFGSIYFNITPMIKLSVKKDTIYRWSLN